MKKNVNVIPQPSQCCPSNNVRFEGYENNCERVTVVKTDCRVYFHTIIFYFFLKKVILIFISQLQFSRNSNIFLKIPI